MHYWEFSHINSFSLEFLQDKKEGYLQYNDQIVIKLLSANVDVLCYKIEELGNKKEQVNPRGQWKQFPNITKWKQWDI